MSSRALDILKQAIAEREAQSGYTEIQHVLLGKGDGLGTLIYNEAEREIWLHKSDTSQQFTAYLPPMAPIPLRDGDPAIERIEVRIGRKPGDKRFSFIDAATPAGVAAMGAVSPMEALIYEAFWATLKNISTLRASVGSVNTIRVEGPYWYRRPSTGVLTLFETVYFSVQTQIAALTAGQHQLSILYLNEETNALGLATATAVAATGALPSRAEFLSTDVAGISLGVVHKPIIPVYLYYGQSSVEEADFYRDWDARGLFSGRPISIHKDLIDSGVVIGANHQMTFSRRITITSSITVAGLLSIVA